MATGWVENADLNQRRVLFAEEEAPGSMKSYMHHVFVAYATETGTDVSGYYFQDYGLVEASVAASLDFDISRISRHYSDLK